MIQTLCRKIYGKENLRENLIELNRQLKSESGREAFLDEFYENEKFYIDLLDEEDAKVRKNVVKLLGCVADTVLLEPLWLHYVKEDTRFVRPDYVEALKSFDCSEFKDELIKIKASLETGEQDKHSAQEIRKLRELIWNIEPPEKHRFTGKNEACDLCLIVPKGMETVVKNSLGDMAGPALAGGCTVKVPSGKLEEILALRTYQGILFDFYPEVIRAGGHQADGAYIGECIYHKGLLPYIKRFHERNHEPFIFRVDVKGMKDVRQKNKAAKDVSDTLEKLSGGTFINDPSHYEIEIRLLFSKANDCRVFLKFYTLKDKRFIYRKKILSVSMHPVRAALMLAWAKDFLKEDANVLDPFCGSGILLIERAKLMGARSFYGLDIYEPAVLASRENSKAAGVHLNMIQRDISDFKHEYSFDEILTDMPRQSGNYPASVIRTIYRTFFDCVPELMGENGILVIYSEEEQLMTEIIKRKKSLSLKSAVPLTASGCAYLIGYEREA